MRWRGRSGPAGQQRREQHDEQRPEIVDQVRFAGGANFSAAKYSALSPTVP
jgi:hypothetical protein